MNLLWELWDVYRLLSQPWVILLGCHLALIDSVTLFAQVVVRGCHLEPWVGLGLSLEPWVGFGLSLEPWDDCWSVFLVVSYLWDYD